MLAPKPIFIHKLYQMDYNRNTKQYRMLQNFIPLVSVRLDSQIFYNVTFMARNFFN